MKINVFDIETYYENNKPIPYCICFSLNNKNYSIYNDKKYNIIQKFFELILINSKKKDVTFFAHNINFDGFLILNHLTSFNYKFDWFVRDTNLYWIKIYTMDITITIRCSLKLIPISVENLGLIINNEKLIFPHKFASFLNLNYIGKVPNIKYFNSEEDYIYFKKKFKDKINFKELVLEYCARDVEIVKKVLEQIEIIVRSYSNTFFWNSFSFSSLSYKLFHKKFDKFKITTRKNDEEFYTYWLRSYHGGRCEVFANPIEKENKIIHYYDVPGMYGQVLKEKFPINPIGITYNNLSIYKIGFHTVRIKSYLEIPVLPYKYNNKLLFPNGTFTGTYWYEELKLFVNKGGIILEHISSLLYEKEEYIFLDFIKHFTEIREKKGFYKIFGKSMINGCYGSFGLREDNNISVLSFNDDEFKFIENNLDIVNIINKNDCNIITVKNNYKYLKFFKKKKNLRSLDIASITASKGRIMLYKGFEETINNGGELYYSDTDSIFAGFNENLLNKSLGMVKWEKIYKDAVFMRPKEYMLKGENLKIKGINTEEKDFHKIKNNFYNNENLKFEEQLQFKKILYELKQNYLKKIVNSSCYTKRNWDIYKKKTTAIILNE